MGESTLLGSGSGSHDSELASLLSGNNNVTEAFVRRHIGWMMAVSQKVLGEKSAAEDAVQNAFAAIFNKLDSFKGKSALRTWMHRIVINEALMLLRKRKQTREDSIDPLQPVFDKNGCRIEGNWSTFQTPEEIAQGSQTTRQVAAFIDQLPDKYRTILVLRDIEDLSTAEVAETLGLSESNVKVRLHRARAALKKLLEPMMNGEAL